MLARQNAPDVSGHTLTSSTGMNSFMPLTLYCRCSVCNKGYSNKVNLNEHMMKHSGEKYKCKYCWKTFTNSRGLLMHTYVHTGMQSYVV